MTIEQFIANNRQTIDAGILRAYDYTCADDDEREDWVINDEGLYLWAVEEGVEI